MPPPNQVHLGFVLMLNFLSRALAISESTFLSRPDLLSPLMNITIYDPSMISPGYWFVSPWRHTSQPAPYIFDNNGKLVWSGFDRSTGADLTIFDFQKIEFHNSTALSFYKGSQHDAHGGGSGYIMDSSYTIQNHVKTGGRLSADSHEFRIIDNGHAALISIYEPKQTDLTPLGVHLGLGWIYDSIFQEIEIETGAVLFEWRSHDHIPIDYSELPPQIEKGFGRSYAGSFDYFHINSVDKNSDGDYLISSRYMSCIYKISGKNGDILWRLGGVQSSFKLYGFDFSAQHHARFQSASKDGKEVITFFNNAHNGWNSTRNYSSGMMVSLDTTSSPKAATLLSEWVLPEPDPQSVSQGNMQMLPNGNVFIGRGSSSHLSEFTSDGTCVLNARFAGEGVHSYRAYKFPWVASPKSVPDIYGYSKTKARPTSFYVSWNGATEVTYWDFYGGHSEGGEFLFLGRVPRSDFETSFKADIYYTFGYAEAMSRDGTFLSRSAVQKTTIPPSTLTETCGEEHCLIGQEDWYPDYKSQMDLPIFFQRAVILTRLKASLYLLLSFCIGIFFAQFGCLLRRIILRQARKNSFALKNFGIVSEDMEALLHNV